MTTTTTTPEINRSANYRDRLMTAIGRASRPQEGETVHAWAHRLVADQIGYIGYEEREMIVAETLGSPNQIATVMPKGLAQLCVDEQPGSSKGVYLHPGRVDLERAKTYHWRWTPQGRAKGVGVEHMEALRVLVVDLDPKRPSGTSATPEEQSNAAKLAAKIYLDLAEYLTSDASLAYMMSGNGCQVHLALDSLPTSTAPTLRIILSYLAALYGTPEVEVDRSMADPRKIIPAAGTQKRKGDHDVASGRCHRRVWIAIPTSETVRLDLEAIEALRDHLASRLTPEQRVAAEALAPAPRESSRSIDTEGAADFAACREACNAVPIRDVASRLGIDLDAPECPKCGQSSPGGSQVAFVDRLNILKCSHANSCTEPAFGPLKLVAKSAFGADDLKGAVYHRVLDWFEENYGIPKPKVGRPLKTTMPSHEAPRATSRTYNMTDLGNAERLLERHGDRIRYVADAGWYVFDGRVWAPDPKGTLVGSLAIETVTMIHVEAEAEKDEEKSKAIRAWAYRSESAKSRKAMVDQLTCLPGIAATFDQFDVNPDILNCPNGVVDLRTGELLPHSPNYMCIMMAGTPYDPSATCPRYLQYLEEAIPCEDSRRYLMRWDGYSLTGRNTEHHFVMHVGLVGRNGKGVHQRCMMHVLRDYATIVSERLLIEQPYQEHTTIKTSLIGRRAAYVSEAVEGAKLNLAAIKELTGGDRVSGRRMRQDEITWEQTAKFQLSMNSAAVVKDLNRAIWDRLIRIDWGTYFLARGEPVPDLPAGTRVGVLDPHLSETLREEATGILALLVRECMAWYRDGLPMTDRLREAREEYRRSQDTVGRFVEESLVIDPKYRVGAGTLYDAYREWCDDNGHIAMASNKFSERVLRNPKITRTKGRVRYYEGVALSVDNESTKDALDDDLQQSLQLL